MAVPGLVRRGPFSYDETNYVSNRTYSLTKSQFDTTNGEIIEVFLNGIKITGSGLNASGDDFTATYTDNVGTSITVNSGVLNGGSTVAHTSGTVLIRRLSTRSTPQVDFAPGSVIREQDLDNSTNQTLHVAQEAMDIAISSIGLDTDDEWDGKSKVIKNVDDGSADNDAVNVGQLETHDTTITGYMQNAEDYKNTAISYATKDDGVAQTYTNDTASDTSDHSAKAHASVVGTNAPSTGSAKEWAQTTGVAIDTTYSAKEYAQGSTLAAGGSAKNWAQLATTPTTTAEDASAKEWAIGVSTHKNEGSAKDWAVYTSGDVRGASAGSMSSKEWAVGIQGRGVAGEGSAKDWATRAEDSTVDDAGYSALHWAAKAEDSRIAAANSASAVGQVYDNFNDVYLGSMADGATADTGTLTGASWSKDSSSIAFTGTTGTISVGQELTSTGSGYPVGANIIGSSVSTPLTVSAPFTSAGSGTLTFVGSGVYGAYDNSKDGPSTNNDGDALVSGNLFFNSTDNEMRIYDGANWIAATSAGSTSLLEYKYVTTSGQVSSKTYSGTADVGGTLSYTQDNIIVFMNGVQLKNGTDYTASNGTSIVLTTAAVAGDEIAIIAFKSFTTADMVSKSNGGTFAGAVTFGAGLVANTVDINGGTIDGATIGASSHSTGKFTTCDATTDFTVGGLVITNNTITDDGTLTITATTGITLGQDTALSAGKDLETSTTGKVIQKGAFMQSSTHQALTLGY